MRFIWFLWWHLVWPPPVSSCPCSPIASAMPRPGGSKPTSTSLPQPLRGLAAVWGAEEMNDRVVGVVLDQHQRAGAVTVPIQQSKRTGG